MRTGRRGGLLIVEGHGRLSRAEPILAQVPLAQCTNAGISVVTASDGKVYTYRVWRPDRVRCLDGHHSAETCRRV